MNVARSQVPGTIQPGAETVWTNGKIRDLYIQLVHEHSLAG